MKHVSARNQKHVIVETSNKKNFCALDQTKENIKSENTNTKNLNYGEICFSASM